MKVAYISGAYRSYLPNGKVNPSGIYDNIQEARKVAIKYWKLGYAVICPHTNTAMMDGACDDQIWIKGDIELLRRSNIVVMLPNFEQSEGARRELVEACLCDLEIIYE